MHKYNINITEKLLPFALLLLHIHCMIVIIPLSIFLIYVVPSIFLLMKNIPKQTDVLFIYKLYKNIEHTVLQPI